MEPTSGCRTRTGHQTVSLELSKLVHSPPIRVHSCPFVVSVCMDPAYSNVRRPIVTFTEGNEDPCSGTRYALRSLRYLLCKSLILKFSADFADGRGSRFNRPDFIRVYPRLPRHSSYEAGPSAENLVSLFPPLPPVKSGTGLVAAPPRQDPGVKRRFLGSLGEGF
jgi:hypothetical protein